MEHSQPRKSKRQRIIRRRRRRHRPEKLHNYNIQMRDASPAKATHLPPTSVHFTPHESHSLHATAHL